VLGQPGKVELGFCKVGLQLEKPVETCTLSIGSSRR
jgi:hypothetical protein